MVRRYDDDGSLRVLGVYFVTDIGYTWSGIAACRLFDDLVGCDAGYLLFDQCIIFIEGDDLDILRRANIGKSGVHQGT